MSYKNKYHKYKKKYNSSKKNFISDFNTNSKKLDGKFNNVSNIELDFDEKTYESDDKSKIECLPDVDGVDRSKAKFTNISINSVSCDDMLSDIIKKYFDTNKITITDGTANIGSDTIRLALKFKNVNSVEIDKLTFDYLRNNINLYKLNNVNVYNDSILSKIKKLKQDVIYIDAPWGGPNYKKFKFIKLYLGSVEISQFYNENKDKAKLFIFKVPKNYDINYFILKTAVDNLKIFVNKKEDRVIYLLLVIHHH